MPDLDWPTVAFVALLIVGLIALVWIVVFALVARRVTRFQDAVMQSMKLGNDNAPTWKSSRTYGPRRGPRRDPRDQTEGEGDR